MQPLLVPRQSAQAEASTREEPRGTTEWPPPGLGDCPWAAVPGPPLNTVPITSYFIHPFPASPQVLQGSSPAGSELCLQARGPGCGAAVGSATTPSIWVSGEKGRNEHRGSEKRGPGGHRQPGAEKAQVHRRGHCVHGARGPGNAASGHWRAVPRPPFSWASGDVNLGYTDSAQAQGDGIGGTSKPGLGTAATMWCHQPDNRGLQQALASREHAQVGGGEGPHSPPVPRPWEGPRTQEEGRGPRGLHQGGSGRFAVHFMTFES